MELFSMIYSNICLMDFVTIHGKKAGWMKLDFSLYHFVPLMEAQTQPYLTIVSQLIYG